VTLADRETTGSRTRPSNHKPYRGYDVSKGPNQTDIEKERSPCGGAGSRKSTGSGPRIVQCSVKRTPHRSLLKPGNLPPLNGQTLHLLKLHDGARRRFWGLGRGACGSRAVFAGSYKHRWLTKRHPVAKGKSSWGETLFSWMISSESYLPWVPRSTLLA